MGKIVPNRKKKGYWVMEVFWCEMFCENYLTRDDVQTWAIFHKQLELISPIYLPA